MFEEVDINTETESIVAPEANAELESLRAEAHSVINEWQTAYRLLECQFDKLQEENKDLSTELETLRRIPINERNEEKRQFTCHSEEDSKENSFEPHLKLLESVASIIKENVKTEELQQVEVCDVNEVSDMHQKMIPDSPEEKISINQQVYLSCKQENELLLNEHERLVRQIEVQERKWEEFLQAWIHEFIYIESITREFIEEDFACMTSEIKEYLYELYKIDKQSTESIYTVNKQCAELRERLKHNESELMQSEREKLELQELSLEQLNLINNCEMERNNLFCYKGEHERTIKNLEGQVQQLCSENCKLVKQIQELETESKILKETCTNTLIEFNAQKESHQNEIECIKTRFEIESRNNEAELKMRTEQNNLLERFNQEITSSLCESSLFLLTKEEFDSCSSKYEIEIKNWEEEYTKCSQEVTRANNKCAEQQSQIIRLQETVNELSVSNALLETNVNSESDKCSELNIRNAWLKEQVESMREELSELESAFNINLHTLREEYEVIYQENKELKKQLEDVHEQVELKQVYIAKMELENVQLSEKIALFELSLRTMSEKTNSVECKVNKLEAELKKKEEQAEENAKDYAEWHYYKQQLTSKIEAYEEQIATSMKTYNTELNEYKRKVEEQVLSLCELENVNVKLRQEMLICNKTNQELRNKVESLESEIHNSQKLVKTYATREENLEEVLRKLTSERDKVSAERDKLEQEQCRLHAIIDNLQSEYKDQFTNQLMLLITLSEKQEQQLEELRRKCAFSGKVLKMFISSTEHTESSTFTKEINLIEGPIRHPKKRTKQELNKSTS